MSNRQSAPVPARRCCEAVTKKTGKPCQGNARPSDRYCYLHTQDPAIVQARKEGTRLGGRPSKGLRMPDAQRPDLSSAEACAAFATDVAHWTQTGLISPSVGKILLLAIKEIRELHSVTVIAERIEELRQRVAEMKQIK